jgi:hypothetical protein
MQKNSVWWSDPSVPCVHFGNTSFLAVFLEWAAEGATLGLK